MANRLAQSQSLYLRKHADNPIDWWPWCEEALQTARQENKPIFLSIGYSSCHWCTVMEGEAFSDAAIAEYMNAHFLPIKVDREERPDLDSIYMQALQMLSGQGGWPLNVFLAPDDLVPFYGGTYFPVEAKYGRPGFLQVLAALRQFYDTEKTKLDAVKTEILDTLQQATMLPEVETLTQTLLVKGLSTSTRILVPSGSGTCFPMIPYGEAALRAIRFSGAEQEAAQEQDPPPDPERVCVQRGLDLALGGIYDHVGGGFHRYTVDPTWTVPHFEKMLYDNGQIVEYLADLWSLGIKESAFQQAVEGTVQWLKREITAPEGYFYAAQDADSFVYPDAVEPEEGAFYVWGYSELKRLLNEAELTALTDAFTVTEAGNFEEQIVLQRQQPGSLSASALSALGTLFNSRYGTSDRTASFPPARNNQEAKTQRWPGRIPAVTDTKLIVAWNSLMISGLAKAAVAFQEAEYLALAIGAARFILEHQWVNDRLHRLNYEGAPAVPAQSEDYAFLIKALLDIQQANLAFPDLPEAFDWLTIAVDVQAEFDIELWSTDAGGYYNAPSDASERLLVRERTFQDNATPAANGIAIATLVRLALLTEDLSYLDRAERALKAFGVVMEQIPQACPSLFTALDWFRHGTLIRTSANRIPALMQTYLPTAVFAVEPNLPDGAVGLVCQGLSCQEPAQSAEQLLQQIASSLVRA
ncbi:MAG TPA: thioredoxin domain-containing protein [Leptolyngbyaceae cyanobacterium]